MIVYTAYYFFKTFLACGCSSSGSNSTSCTSGGVCSCKTNFYGNKCTSCKAGFYDYPNCYCEIKETIWCANSPMYHLFLACGCSSSGASSTSCNSSGVCSCKSNFEGSKCTSCKTGFYDYPNCYSKNQNNFWLYILLIISSKLFLACGCSSSGSTSTSCTSSGVCTCKTNFYGNKCSSCKTGFYDYPNCSGEI